MRLPSSRRDARHSKQPCGVRGVAKEAVWEEEGVKKPTGIISPRDVRDGWNSNETDGE